MSPPPRPSSRTAGPGAERPTPSAVEGPGALRTATATVMPVSRVFIVGLPSWPSARSREWVEATAQGGGAQWSGVVTLRLREHRKAGRTGPVVLLLPQLHERNSAIGVVFGPEPSAEVLAMLVVIVRDLLLRGAAAASQHQRRADHHQGDGTDAAHVERLRRAGARCDEDRRFDRGSLPVTRLTPPRSLSEAVWRPVRRTCCAMCPGIS